MRLDARQIFRVLEIPGTSKIGVNVAVNGKVGVVGLQYEALIQIVLEIPCDSFHGIPMRLSGVNTVPCA